MPKQCAFVHQGKFGEHRSVLATKMAPQSVDQGKTITWEPVCDDHAEMWWDGADWGPMEMRPVKGPEYTDKPTKVRVFNEDGAWSIDGVDDEGNFTEVVWTHNRGVEFTSMQDALDHAEEFGDKYVGPNAPVLIQDAPRIDRAVMRAAREDLERMLEELDKEM